MLKVFSTYNLYYKTMAGALVSTQNIIHKFSNNDQE